MKGQTNSAKHSSKPNIPNGHGTDEVGAKNATKMAKLFLPEGRALSESIAVLCHVMSCP